MLGIIMMNKHCKSVMSLGDSYRQFLDNGKTERECVVQSVAVAKEAGYIDLKELIKSNTPIKAGDKIYYTHMDKSIALFNIGTDDMDLGYEYSRCSLSILRALT